MLTLVEITNVRSDKLQLTPANSSNGYVVKDIEGLDPVTATLTTSSLAQVDGVQFQNAQRTSRNITMKLGLQPDYVSTTVDSLRTALYDYLMPKANILLGFYKDGVLFATTAGQVESFENSMYSSDPEVDISVICYDPDFYAPAPVVTDIDTVMDTTATLINYAGTSDAGIIFTINVNRDMGSFSLYNVAPDNTVQVFGVTAVSGTFIDGDVITITSIPGMKSVTLTRAAITTSVLYYVDDAATWISLQRGENFFRAYAGGDGVPCVLTYTPLYGAI